LDLLRPAPNEELSITTSVNNTLERSGVDDMVGDPGGSGRVPHSTKGDNIALFELLVIVVMNLCRKMNLGSNTLLGGPTFRQNFKSEAHHTKAIRIGHQRHVGEKDCVTRSTHTIQ
jgi:hypothetical protein